MMTILNALRAAPQNLGAVNTPAMAALTAPATQEDAIKLFFREKASGLSVAASASAICVA